MIFLLTKFTSGKKLQFTSLLAMRSNLVLFCNPLKQNWKIKRCSYPLTRQEQWFVQQRKTLSRLYYEPGIKKELTFETIFITVFIVFIALQNKKKQKKFNTKHESVTIIHCNNFWQGSFSFIIPLGQIFGLFHTFLSSWISSKNTPSGQIIHWFTALLSETLS